MNNVFDISVYRWQGVVLIHSWNGECTWVTDRKQNAVPNSPESDNSAL